MSNSNRTPSLLASVGATTASYKDGAVRRGTAYSYSVRALNAVGEGTASNTVTVTAR